MPIFKFFSLLTTSLLILTDLGSQTRDTLYPGYDLAIITMETAKKEVLAGEGVIMNIVVKNLGASKSPESKMIFYVDSTDESFVADELNKVDVKAIMELEPQAQITFNKLVVIPPYYKKKIAYITANIPLSESYTKDPTPDNNEKITGVRIADIRTYQGGLYSYDTYIKELTSGGMNKIKRNKPLLLTIHLGNNDDKPLKHGEQIEIYASKTKTIDNKSTLVGKMDLPVLRAKENKIVTKEIIFGDQFRKGKIYLIGKVNPGNLLIDPNMENNISAPLQIKLK